MRQWKPEQLELMRWLCRHPSLREPKTMQDLADKLKVSRVAMWKWTQLAEWGEAMQLMAGLVFREMKPDFLAQMQKDMLKSGNYQVQVAVARYLYPMLDSLPQDYFDSVKPSSTLNSVNDPAFRLSRATAYVLTLPTDQQDAALEALRVYAGSSSTVISSDGTSVEYSSSSSSTAQEAEDDGDRYHVPRTLHASLSDRDIYGDTTLEGELVGPTGSASSTGDAAGHHSRALPAPQSKGKARRRIVI